MDNVLIHEKLIVSHLWTLLILVIMYFKYNFHRDQLVIKSLYDCHFNHKLIYYFINVC